MIVNQNHTHVRTNPVRLGRIHLYQPHAFKGDGKTADEQGASKKGKKNGDRIPVAQRPFRIRG